MSLPETRHIMTSYLTIQEEIKTQYLVQIFKQANKLFTSQFKQNINKKDHLK